jgi:CBS domain-containing protein
MSTPSFPTAADFMTTDVQTVTPGMKLSEVIRFLLEHKLSNAPVAEKDVLLGFISEGDCLSHLSDDSYYGTPTPPQTARTIMRAHPTCVHPETEMFALASIFATHAFRHLPVVKDGKLLGIVSRRDVLRAMDEYYSQTEQERSTKQFFRPDLHDITNLRFLMDGR